MTYGGYVSWPDTSLGRNRRNKTLFLWVQQDNMAIILSDTAASWFMEYGWLQRKPMVEERAAEPNKMPNKNVKMEVIPLHSLHICTHLNHVVSRYNVPDISVSDIEPINSLGFILLLP